MRDIVGIPPVPPPALALGKAGVLVSWGILGLRLAGIDLLGTTVPAARVPAAVAGLLGAVVMAAALVRLDEAARVGLPPGHRATRLKTSGLYACSRNPIYTAAILVCVASCVYVPHWVNILATLVAAVVHHRIVLAEERFLERRFGEAWRAYRSRVRRYL